MGQKIKLTKTDSQEKSTKILLSFYMYMGLHKAVTQRSDQSRKLLILFNKEKTKFVKN